MTQPRRPPPLNSLPRPGWFVRLPVDVGSAGDLAAYLVEYSRSCAHEAPATRALLEMAAELEATPGPDLARLSAAYETAQARAAAAVDADTRNAYLGVAYAVARVADGVVERGPIGP